MAPQAIRTFLGRILGDSAKLDYTYWATKFVREGAQMLAKAILGVMNEHGLVVGMVFTRTKETLTDPAAQHLLRTMRMRSDVYNLPGFKCMWSDSVKTDEPHFRRWWPE